MATEKQPTNKGGRGQIRGNNYGAGFDSRPENINRNGVNRKPFSQIAKDAKESGIELADTKNVEDAMKILMGMTITEVYEVRGEFDKQSKRPIENGYPSLLRYLATELISGKNRVVIMREMMDRAHGKAISRIGDIEGNALPAPTINVHVVSSGNPILSLEELECE